MTSVLVVEDSAVIREFLVHLLSEAKIRVMGTAANGAEALAFMKHRQPDVITMDIHMPVMDGIEATRRIMETHPVPIVIVSGNWDPKEVETTFRALEAGALTLVQRPWSPDHPDGRGTAEELVRVVKLMSEVRVVRRWPQKSARAPAPGGRSAVPAMSALTPSGKGVEVVAIGASTGGPPVLQTILSALPRDFPAPLLIVQHMAPGFLGGMLGWLGDTSGPKLCIATQGEPALPGRAYFAPDDCHMGLDADGRILLDRAAREHGARPSVSYLFRSVARARANRAIAVLLTGMGRDGAVEMKLLKDKGAITIAQDRQSAAVFGMPSAAIEMDGAVQVLPAGQIPTVLAQIATKSGKKGE
jgi:two-component system, chemotaxis family, protein-glutamate methylesterase/glutaminase